VGLHLSMITLLAASPRVANAATRVLVQTEWRFLAVGRSVCLSGILWNDGRNDRDAVWGGGLDRSRDAVSGGDRDPSGKGHIFMGENRTVQCNNEMSRETVVGLLL